MDTFASSTALWWAVVLSGMYHGLNPGMGWPLAVSAALMDRHSGSLWRALLALAGGHLAAMIAILLPFSALLVLVEWEAVIRTSAAVLVIALGIYLLITRRHPRFLARIHPSKLMLWSFLAALAHGAALMLVPIYLGICETVADDAAHSAASHLIRGGLGVALLVAFVHTLAMFLSGGAMALGVYLWLGLKFLSKSWFNLEIVWAVSLIVVGLIALLWSH